MKDPKQRTWVDFLIMIVMGMSCGAIFRNIWGLLLAAVLGFFYQNLKDLFFEIQNKLDE